jgi:hypothetical protein
MEKGLSSVVQGHWAPGLHPKKAITVAVAVVFRSRFQHPRHRPPSFPSDIPKECHPVMKVQQQAPRYSLSNENLPRL